jgi:hypothetical protein
MKGHIQDQRKIANFFSFSYFLIFQKLYIINLYLKAN